MRVVEKEVSGFKAAQQTWQHCGRKSSVFKLTKYPCFNSLDLFMVIALLTTHSPLLTLLRTINKLPLPLQEI
jgi:hypothetical protein